MNVKLCGAAAAEWLGGMRLFQESKTYDDAAVRRVLEAAGDGEVEGDVPVGGFTLSSLPS